MTAALTEKFVQRFCTWADSCGYPARIRRRLPPALRRFAHHVASQDAYADVVIRTLPNPVRTAFCVDLGDAWVYTANSRIVLGAIAPNWRGTRTLARDKDVTDLLSDFAHLGSQYVLRSRIVRAQFALAAVYRVSCDFRRADLRRSSVRVADVPAARVELEADLPRPRARMTGRTRQLRAWMATTNPLDPHIHRALYQYWRAVALHGAHFYEDSVGALDSVVAVGAEALHLWLRLREQPSRPACAKLLNLSDDDQAMADKLYALRCGFGAHPPVSKWWDFSEIYEDDIEDFFDLVARFLQQLCLAEHRLRRVEPAPPAWGPWFASHAETLLDAVWFTRLP